MNTMQYTIGNFEFITDKMKIVTKMVSCIYFSTFQRVSFWLRKIYIRNRRTPLGHLTSALFSVPIIPLFFFSPLGETNGDGNWIISIKKELVKFTAKQPYHGMRAVKKNVVGL